MPSGVRPRARPSGYANGAPPRSGARSTPARRRPADPSGVHDDHAVSRSIGPGAAVGAGAAWSTPEHGECRGGGTDRAGPGGGPGGGGFRQGVGAGFDHRDGAGAAIGVAGGIVDDLAVTLAMVENALEQAADAARAHGVPVGGDGTPVAGFTGPPWNAAQASQRQWAAGYQVFWGDAMDTARQARAAAGQLARLYGKIGPDEGSPASTARTWRPTCAACGRFRPPTADSCSRASCRG
jgi:hypothetical protein